MRAFGWYSWVGAHFNSGKLKSQNEKNRQEREREIERAKETKREDPPP